MRVLVLNGSPRKERGGTAQILSPFLEGMSEVGAQVEVLCVYDLELKPCLGCFACWVKTPGQCAQKDDVAEVLPKLAVADVVVLATPVYVDGMTGPMKTLLDRLIPLIEPFFEIREGHCRHARREGVKAGQLALVSVSGFTELDNFAPLVAHVRAVCKNMGRAFAGALLRPYGASLAALQQMGISVDDVIEAARSAGRQLVREGQIAQETLAVVSRELVPREDYVRAVNASFERALTSRHGE
jgi:multimeric flavodoxin WrbA